MLCVGDKVDVYYVPKKVDKYNLIYSDQNVVVIDKKSGYTSENIFEEICNSFCSARFIHRLDRNTSGLMIFALNDESEKLLLEGFKNHDFIKQYIAVVYGKMPKQKDILTAYLLKDSTTSTVRIFDNKIKDSVMIKTGYEVIKFEDNISTLLVTLYTGKTHQIRAHLAYLGHFIIGDGKYGNNQINKKLGVKSQMLNSYKLTLKFSANSPLNYLNNKTFISKLG